jgi:hypothetical protein
LGQKLAGSEASAYSDSGKGLQGIEQTLRANLSAKGDHMQSLASRAAPKKSGRQGKFRRSMWSDMQLFFKEDT